jgi:hypothetical protein
VTKKRSKGPLVVMVLVAVGALVLGALILGRAKLLGNAPFPPASAVR